MMAWISLGASLLAVLVSITTFLINRHDTKHFRHEDRMNSYRAQSQEIWQLGINEVSACIDMGTQLEAYFSVPEKAGIFLSLRKEKMRSSAIDLENIAKKFYAKSVTVPPPLISAIYEFQEAATELAVYVKALVRAIYRAEHDQKTTVSLAEIEECFEIEPTIDGTPRTWSALVQGDITKRNHQAYRNMMLISQGLSLGIGFVPKKK
jgi:hypothetical protein